MLKGVLYEIVSRSDDSVTVRIDRGCCIFQAHFPGYPITPGVTFVQMAVELLGLIKGRDMDILSAKNIKFLSPVIPQEDTTLTFFFGGDGEIKVYHRDVVCASMKVTAG